MVPLINISRTSFDLGGPGRPILGCGEQADQAVVDQERRVHQDDWTFKKDQYGGFHQVAVGYSSNPNDPIVIIDPWRNTVKKLPRAP
jgi:hypothetical protein